MTRTLTPEQTVYDYTGQGADSISPNQDSLAFVFVVNKSGPVAYTFKLNTSQSGLDDDETYTVDVKLFGKVFSTDSWVSVDATNTGKDATADLTVDINNETDTYKHLNQIETTDQDSISYASGFHYRYYKLEITENTSTNLEGADYATVDYLYLKVWPR